MNGVHPGMDGVVGIEVLFFVVWRRTWGTGDREKVYSSLLRCCHRLVEDELSLASGLLLTECVKEECGGEASWCGGSGIWGER